MRNFEPIALGIPEVLLPRKGLDLTKWAVIACDQFTSEQEYWQKAATMVGDAPSTLNLIFPEVYLSSQDAEARITRIRESMKDYLDREIFEEAKGFVYVERQTGQRTRMGLMVCLDLEQYDFRRGAGSLIRATEGTILKRLPPRVRIREGAPLEVPHIMVLIDDPENRVIGPLTAAKERLRELYEVELMMDSGHLTGYQVEDSLLEEGVVDSLRALADPGAFAEKYRMSPDEPVLLYAMGDGNHSLATAKTIWEKTKANAADRSAVMSSPLRYALVELVNLHDEALVFEPIHRMLFDLAEGRNPVEEIKAFYSGRCSYSAVGSADEMTAAVDSQAGNSHKIGLVSSVGFGVLEVTDPDSNLPVGTLQNFLDLFLGDGGAQQIDYVHGTDPVVNLGKKPKSAGFYLPGMDKNDLFKTVILDGALPRKTFSMGEAWEKRFYMEARRLT